MDIAGLGERGVRLLLERGLIGDEADLFTLAGGRPADAGRVRREESAEPAGQHRSAKQRPLAVLIGSLGIRGVGSTVAEVLARHFHSMDALPPLPKRNYKPSRESARTPPAVVEFAGPHRALLDKLRRAGVRLAEEAAPPQRARSAGRADLR